MSEIMFVETSDHENLRVDLIEKFYPGVIKQGGKDINVTYIAMIGSGDLHFTTDSVEDFKNKIKIQQMKGINHVK